MAGKFITLEGGEGTGKSTQAVLLRDRLRARGIETVVTREPGGTPGAEAIRTLLVSGAADRWRPETEALLNYAARDDHLARIIIPALEAGAWVICDRFLDSTRTYQGVAGGVDRALIASLETAIVGDHMPDLTLVLDIDPEHGLTRAGERARGSSADEARFEAKDAAFHARLRQGFLDIAAREPDRCVVVDAAQEPSKVADAMWGHIEERVAP